METADVFAGLTKTLAADGVVTFTVRARPGAKATGCTGMLADGSLKISVHAPPEDGQANEELIVFLSEIFDVPRSSVGILSGHSGRIKTLRISRQAN